MKAVKVHAPVERDEIGNMESESIFMARATDGTETFELEVQTFFVQRGRKWVPRETDLPETGEPCVQIRQRHSLTRREVLRWFVDNWIPEVLRKDFAPVTKAKRGAR